MVQGNLLPEKQLIMRQAQQTGTFTDPVDGKEHELEFTTAIGGSNNGCPIIRLGGRMVGWDFKDFADEAIKIFRENGVLPKEGI